MANKSAENTAKCRPKELYRLDGKVAVVFGGAVPLRAREFGLDRMIQAVRRLYLEICP